MIVVGLGGEKKYSDAFRAMAVAMVGAAEKKLGLDPAHIVSLGEAECDAGERAEGAPRGGPSLRAGGRRVRSS